MYAVLVTFQSTASADDVREPFTQYAQALQEVEGVVMKTWLQDGATIGGFHVFTSRDAAERYLNGDLFAQVNGNPAFSNFQYRHFSVFDDWSATTGTPTAPLARTPAAVR